MQEKPKVKKNCSAAMKLLSDESLEFKKNKSCFLQKSRTKKELKRYIILLISLYFVVQFLDE